jgi:hypothetical protein
VLSSVPVTAIVAPGGRAIEIRPSYVFVSKDLYLKMKQKFLLPMRRKGSGLAAFCDEAEATI